MPPSLTVLAASTWYRKGCFQGNPPSSSDTLDKMIPFVQSATPPPLFIRVSGASHRPNSRQNDQTRQKGKNRVDGRHGKIRRGCWRRSATASISLWATSRFWPRFQASCQARFFSSCVLTIQNRPNHRGMYPTAAKALGRCYCRRGALHLEPAMSILPRHARSTTL
jgi:hypothetical protein